MAKYTQRCSTVLWLMIVRVMVCVVKGVCVMGVERVDGSGLYILAINSPGMSVVSGLVGKG